MKEIWIKISHFGLIGNELPEEKRHIELVNRIALLSCVFTPFFIPILFFCGNYFTAITQGIYSCILPVYFLFAKKQKFQIAILSSYILVISNLALCMLVNPFVGVEFLFFPVSLIPFMVFKQMRHCIIVFLSTFVLFILLQILKPFIPSVIELDFVGHHVLFFTLLLMSFIIILFVMYNFKIVIEIYEKNLVKQKMDIEVQKHLVDEKQKEILDSIHYAKRIQQALLPQEKYLDRLINEQKQDKMRD